MKFISLLGLLIFFAAALADQQQPTQAHLVAEAQMKQQFVERLRSAHLNVTDNQKLYDVTFYRLDLFPDVVSKTLYGDVSMLATSLSDGLASVELDFFDNMVVDSVFVDGQSTDYTHADDLLTILFSRLLDKNETFVTRVVYHGNPAQTGFGAFGFDSHAGKPMVWTLSEPFGARNWWPCKDAPIDKADSVDINVKVRADLIVAANGTLKEVTLSGDFKTYWWQERYPIATYLVSLAIHPYYTYSDWYVTPENDSMEVQYYVFQNDVAWAKSENANTVAMIKAFSEIFGEYPFFNEKYGHAQFLWGGGMEHQTITSLGSYSESLIAHELAHQWWGDMVTCEDFHHIWLNEGFATYSEALWWEHKYGEEALFQDMANNVYLGEETIYIENPKTDNIFFYPTTYAKAAWVLHMLRHVVGDEVFFDILKTYYKEFKFETVTTEQFKQLCERLSGKELKTFFDQWIYGAGVPHYEHFWWSERATDSGWLVKGIIRQTQVEPAVFEMPVDITVKTAQSEQTFILQNNQREETYEFYLQEEPTSVSLDKKNWILKRVSTISEPILQVLDVWVTNSNGQPQTAFAPGQSGRLFFSVKNSGVSAKDVTAQLVTADPDVTISTAPILIGQIESGEIFQSDEAAFIFNVANRTVNKLARLELVFYYAGGSSSPYSFSLPIGSPTLLIVDDDDGADYEKYYEQMAIQIDEFAATWSIEDRGLLSLDTLDRYDHIVWFTGDDSTNSLTTTEQSLIGDYLANGGHLLLSGQHIGYDLVENGDELEKLFYTNILKAVHVPGVLADFSVVGVPGDAVGQGLAVRFDDLGTGADNQNFLRQLDPLPPAVSSFIFLPSQKSAGIRFMEPTTDARLVYLTFGLEGIEGPRQTSAADLLKKVLAWFNDIGTSSDNTNGSRPSTFVLEQNYPNPFNPGTTIRFYNPERNHVNIEIYNSLGQKVRQLFDGPLETGWHFIDWDGCLESGEESASGIYLFQVRSQEQNTFAPKSVKMLKLK